MSDHFLVFLEDELSRRTGLYILPLEIEAHNSLVAHFDEMADNYARLSKVEYDVGYRPESGEVHFAPACMPESLQTHLVVPHETPALNLDTLAHADLKYLVHVRVDDALSGDGEPELRYQILDKRRKLRPGRGFRFWQQQLQLIQEPGLHIGDQIDGLFLGGHLLFKSYTLANRFLDLKGEVCSQGQATLRKFADASTAHVVFADLDAVEKSMKPLLARLIAVVDERKLLTKYSANELKAAASSIGLRLDLEDGKLVVPADVRVAKLVLRFLAQQLLKCPVSSATFEANSARPIAL